MPGRPDKPFKGAGAYRQTEPSAFTMTRCGRSDSFSVSHVVVCLQASSPATHNIDYYSLYIGFTVFRIAERWRPAAGPSMRNACNVHNGM